MESLENEEVRLSTGECQRILEVSVVFKNKESTTPEKDLSSIRKEKKVKMDSNSSSSIFLPYQ